MITEADGRKSPTTGLLLLVGSVVMALIGRWAWAWNTFLSAMILALCSAMQQIKEEDKQEIRFHVIDAEDLVKEMQEWSQQLLKSKLNSDDPAFNNQILIKSRLVIDTGLTVLAKKYNQFQLDSASETVPHKEILSESKKDILTPSHRNSEEEKERDEENLALLCQQAAYIGFSCYPNDDSIVAASISLLALVAKNSGVRERHLYQADIYGLNIPIQCIQSALERAREYSDSDKKRERFAAELQRKSCLLLGALASDDVELANTIVQEGGLEAILEALSWYRYHADLTNWALWAIFILCYENPVNKIAVVQLDGVPLVVQAMRLCPDSVDVARHGVAVLFDLMRESTEQEEKEFQKFPKLDIWKIRSSALQAGLHKAVVSVMELYYDAMDIMMMGQEILLGTGFTGEIPEYLPVRI